jgi:hypothetical protein
VGHKGAKEQIMFQERLANSGIIRIWRCPMQQLRADVEFLFKSNSHDSQVSGKEKGQALTKT